MVCLRLGWQSNGRSRCPEHQKRCHRPQAGRALGDGTLMRLPLPLSEEQPLHKEVDFINHLVGLRMRCGVERKLYCMHPTQHLENC
jgi:hypothetical protein